MGEECAQPPLPSHGSPSQLPLTPRRQAISYPLSQQISLGQFSLALSLSNSVPQSYPLFLIIDVTI